MQTPEVIQIILIHYWPSFVVLWPGFPREPLSHWDAVMWKCRAGSGGTWGGNDPETHVFPSRSTSAWKNLSG